MAICVDSHHKSSTTFARDALIEDNLALARRLAGRYRHSGESPDDLQQVACLGLIKAADRYDPSRGSFARFAVPTISGELKRHFRDRGWSMHVSRELQERTLDVTEAVDELTGTLGRSPTPRDVAAYLNIGLEQVLEAMDAASAYAPASLDAPLAPAFDDETTTLGQQLGADDPRFELAEWRPAIEPALAALTPREREILRMRFSDDRTQAEIAERIGVSQMHVSRLLRRALARLAHAAA